MRIIALLARLSLPLLAGAWLGPPTRDPRAAASAFAPRAVPTTGPAAALSDPSATPALLVIDPMDRNGRLFVEAARARGAYVHEALSRTLVDTIASGVYPGYDDDDLAFLRSLVLPELALDEADDAAWDPLDDAADDGRRVDADDAARAREWVSRVLPDGCELVGVVVESDDALEAAARWAEALGLAARDGRATTARLLDKARATAALARAHVPCARQRHARDADEAVEFALGVADDDDGGGREDQEGEEPRCVALKPSRGAGSTNVYRRAARDAAGVRAAFEALRGAPRWGGGANERAVASAVQPGGA